MRGGYRLQQVSHWAADPGRVFDQHTGREDSHFPGVHRLLDLPPRPPTLLHVHNLHGGYFDLRALPCLSARLPVVMTLYDAGFQDSQVMGPAESRILGWEEYRLDTEPDGTVDKPDSLYMEAIKP